MQLSDVIDRLTSIQYSRDKFPKHEATNMLWKLGNLVQDLDEVISVLADAEDQIDNLTRDLNEATERIAEYETELGMVMVG